MYCTSNHNTFKVSLVFSLTGKCVKETFGNNGLFDSKEANQDAKMDRIFQMLHKFKIRVLPPQPDRVVVTDFVTTTFLFDSAISTHAIILP